MEYEVPAGQMFERKLIKKIHTALTQDGIVLENVESTLATQLHMI